MLKITVWGFPPQRLRAEGISRWEETQTLLGKRAGVGICTGPSRVTGLNGSSVWALYPETQVMAWLDEYEEYSQ